MSTSVQDVDGVVELKGKQRRYLKGLANRIKPSVYAGKDGPSPGLMQSIEEAYNTSELIKIRLEKTCPIDRNQMGSMLAKATDSYLIQTLGHTLLLYRPDPDEPKLQLPS